MHRILSLACLHPSGVSARDNRATISKFLPFVSPGIPRSRPPLELRRVPLCSPEFSFTCADRPHGRCPPLNLGLPFRAEVSHGKVKPVPRFADAEAPFVLPSLSQAYSRWVDQSGLVALAFLSSPDRQRYFLLLPSLRELETTPVDGRVFFLCLALTPLECGHRKAWPRVARAGSRCVVSKSTPPRKIICGSAPCAHLRIAFL